MTSTAPTGEPSPSVEARVTFLTLALLGLNATIYFAMAAASLMIPERVAAEFGLTILNGCGSSEFMAAFGAIPLALVLFFVRAMRRPDARAEAVCFAALLYGSFVVVRTLAVFEAGWTEMGNARLAFGVDVVMFTWAFALKGPASRARQSSAANTRRARSRGMSSSSSSSQPA